MYLLVVRWGSEVTAEEFPTRKALKEYLEGKGSYNLNQNFYICRVLATEKTVLEKLTDEEKKVLGRDRKDI